MKCNAIWKDVMICLRIPVLTQPYIHDTPRKYIESSWPMGDSRGPYTDTDDLHVSVRTISTHYHKIKQFPLGRSPRAQIIILTSHHPQHERSPHAQLLLNLTSMHVHNIISIKGDDDAPQSIYIRIIHNHPSYHNYTGVRKKTNSKKDFKSIIYQLMPICFGILKL